MLGDGGIEGQQCDRAQEQLKIGVALSAENVVCYNSHFWGKKDIRFWSAQSLQAEYGFTLMHADFLIYDDCGSVVFLTCHDTTFLFILVYDRSQEFP